MNLLLFVFLELWSRYEFSEPFRFPLFCTPFLCSSCNITLIISHVKRWVLIILWKKCDLAKAYPQHGPEHIWKQKGGASQTGAVCDLHGKSEDPPGASASFRRILGWRRMRGWSKGQNDLWWKKGDIISQYVAFTRVYNEQIKLHGRTRKAVLETIRICRDSHILKEYLEAREQEVKQWLDIVP